MILDKDIKQGKCSCNDYKTHCKLDVCCFECEYKSNDECVSLSDRCFVEYNYKAHVNDGYPMACRLYECIK